MGLAQLGHSTVRQLLLPVLPQYFPHAESAAEQAAEPSVRSEARHVMAALVATVGGAIRDRLTAEARSVLTHFEDLGDFGVELAGFRGFSSPRPRHGQSHVGA